MDAHSRLAPAILARMSDLQTATPPEITSEIREAARQAGGGWLDEVVGNHPAPVPMSAIRGAWKIGPDGEPTGEYVANPGFEAPRPRSRCPYGH
jgi:hypothetical protein